MEFIVIIIGVVWVLGRRKHVRLESTQYADSHQEARRKALWSAKNLPGFDPVRIKGSKNRTNGSYEG